MDVIKRHENIPTIYLIHFNQFIAGFAQAINTGLEDFQGEQGTFQAHRAEFDAEQVEHILLGEFLHIFHRLANNGTRSAGRPRLARWRSLCRRNGHPSPCRRVHPQGHFDVVAAERVVILEMNIVRIEVAAVLRVLVMVNDEFAIKIVHSEKSI